MTNHFHLISTPEHAVSLSFAMRDLPGPYASYFNHKHGFSGRLWQGRFYSTVLDETHFWAAVRYVERNPVRAGMVIRAEDCIWSAAAAHCGIRQDPLLTPLPAIPSYISSWPSWIKGEDDRQEIKLIRTTTKTGWPCGSSPFIEELERALGIKFGVRKAGRNDSKVSLKCATLPFVR
jgi:putative transposase